MHMHHNKKPLSCCTQKGEQYLRRGLGEVVAKVVDKVSDHEASEAGDSVCLFVIYPSDIFD